MLIYSLLYNSNLISELAYLQISYIIIIASSKHLNGLTATGKASHYLYLE